jgi:hypothetical protein
MTGRSHGAVQPRPSIFRGSKVVVSRDLGDSQSASIEIDRYNYKSWEEEVKNLAVGQHILDSAEPGTKLVIVS